MTNVFAKAFSSTDPFALEAKVLVPVFVKV